MDTTKVVGKENEPTPKTSTPLKECSFGSDANISHISVASTASKSKGHNLNEGKENLHTDLDTTKNLDELKSVMLQRNHLFHQHKENLEEINRQISNLRLKLEQEKQEVYAALNTFKEIEYVERRSQVEHENLALTSDMQLQQHFEQLMTAISHDRNQLKLKNISLFSDDQFKKLLKEAHESIKSFHESGEFEAVEKLAAFLPALEESIDKCNASNEKCAEITEGIRRLLLHKKTLRSIDQSSKSSVQ